jgi:glycosyltransferase involved in cell wall biosynthesis
MRIMFISPVVNMSGGIRVMVTYAQRLMQRGHTVRIISPPPRTPPFSRKIKEWLKGNGWPSDPQPPKSHLDGSRVEHQVLDRWRAVTDDDVPDGDVVIATWWETAEWVAGLSPCKGAKAFFIQHHEVFDPLPVERVKATWRLPLHKITISNWLVELAAREYGDAHVWLVPNSVDTDLFHAPPRGRQAQPTVGLLYSTFNWKGVDVSLRAIDRAAKRVSGLRLVAFGAEPVTDRLPLPTGTTFHHLPAQDSIRDLYASCDVWLCGSYSEGFHLPPLEAMACRCPVVSTRVGGPIDIIKPGRNGYLAPVGDADALADRLVDVLSLDNAQWRAMSDAALETATKYTWDDATNLLESALRDVIANPSKVRLADRAKTRFQKNRSHRQPERGL